MLYLLLNLFTTGGYKDHSVGPGLCFTLRGQSYISKVPDPEKAFNMIFLGRVRVHGKKAESDPFPGGMPTLGHQGQLSSRVSAAPSPPSPTTQDRPFPTYCLGVSGLSRHKHKQHRPGFQYL